ncbi:beta-1,4-N-acetylgalactosaminyltransferase bre-4-like [Haemaphysalis longicornis]
MGLVTDREIYQPTTDFFVVLLQVISIKALLPNGNFSQKRIPKLSLRPLADVTRRNISLNTPRASPQWSTSAPLLCPVIPPNSVGYIEPVLNVGSLTDVIHKFPHVSEGGRFKPNNCTSRHRVAILIPYRNRSDHLNVLLYHLHRFLAQQQLDYGVFVIEQIDNEEFNRAKLLNVGFIQSLALYDYQCFIFHDVDLLPIDDRNVYSCPEHPRHLSRNITGYKGDAYAVMFGFGGVSALGKHHMHLVNGYSNLYWGWGAEDDDMLCRLKHANLSVINLPANVSRYVTLQHNKAPRHDRRLKLLADCWRRYKADGLNSLTYRTLSVIGKKLCTWIRVDLRNPESLRNSSARPQVRT